MNTDKNQDQFCLIGVYRCSSVVPFFVLGQILSPRHPPHAAIRWFGVTQRGRSGRCVMAQS
jgi:hypothetical protein